MDHFSEQLVHKYPSPADTLRKTLIITAAVLVSLIAIFLGIAVFPGFIALVVLAAVGAWYLVSRMYTEYEYTVTNGELDIDKIEAKKNRYSLLSMNVREFTDICKVTEDTALDDDNMTRYHCSDGSLNHLVFADFARDSEERCRLYFSPSQKTLEAMLPFVREEVREKTAAILELMKEREATPEEDK